MNTTVLAGRFLLFSFVTWALTFLHGGICLAIFAVPPKNVLCHTLFKNRLITGCINAGNFLCRQRRARNGIERVPLLPPGFCAALFARNRRVRHPYEFRYSSITRCSTGVCSARGFVFTEVLSASAFSRSARPPSSRRGTLPTRVLPPSHQSESSRSSSSPSEFHIEVQLICRAGLQRERRSFCR